jgi:hypothetical protein
MCTLQPQTSQGCNTLLARSLMLPSVESLAMHWRRYGTLSSLAAPPPPPLATAARPLGRALPLLLLLPSYILVETLKVDWMVGKVWGLFEELQIANNTLFLFFSDNGVWSFVNRHLHHPKLCHNR